MSAFFLIFFTIYGSFHLYALLKARAAFRFKRRGLLILAVLITPMIATPALIRIAEREGFDLAARLLAYAGYLWMALLFLFVCISLALDIYRLCIIVGEKTLGRNFKKLRPSPLAALILPLAAALIFTGYGYFAAQDIRINRIIIPSAKIPARFNGLKIVQISDIHLGLLVGKNRLEKILAAVRKAGPDILVSTGDLVDGQPNNLTDLADLLADIKPPFGKYAVTGNHEFYAGIDHSLKFLNEAGFTVLRNEALTVADGLNILGIDDKVGTRFGQTAKAPEQALLATLDRTGFTLLLKHRPEVTSGSEGLFDLQLSGHTHNGQIYPFIHLSRLVFPAKTGQLLKYGDSRLYVSPGAGTWGPPVRFLAKPEITVFELTRATP